MQARKIQSQAIQAKALRARIVALGQDLQAFQAIEDREAVRACKRALAKAEAELTDLFVNDGGKTQALHYASDLYRIAHQLNQTEDLDGTPCRETFKAARAVLQAAFGVDVADVAHEHVCDSGEYDVNTLKGVINDYKQEQTEATERQREYQDASEESAAMGRGASEGRDWASKHTVTRPALIELTVKDVAAKRAALYTGRGQLREKDSLAYREAFLSAALKAFALEAPVLGQ